MTDSRRPSEAQSTEVAAEAAAAGGLAAEAHAGGGPATSKSGPPAKAHGDPLAEAIKGGKHASPEPAGRHASADGDGGSAEHPLAAEIGALLKAVEERTRDLQRVTAEYANYRKRVDRDRAAVVEKATGDVIAVLLPILDDLDRAREHGDLTGPFGVVAEQLTAALAKFGLEPFGAQGDPFDPTRHEAVAHRTSPEVSEPSCVGVMRRGYLIGERLLRPALVEVADPE